MTTKPDSSPDVAVLGAAAIDWIARVKELPRRDGIVFAEEYQPMPGGTGGNVAEAVARLGHRVRFFGKFGDDEGGQLLLKSFQDAGVGTEGVLITKNRRTASCFIAIDERGERQIYCLGGSAIYESTSELDPRLLRGVKVLFIADAFLEVALEAIEMVSPAATIIFNPGGVMASSGDACLKPIVARTGVLIVSQVESETITHMQDPRDAMLRLAEMGAKVVMQTQGAAGVMVLENGDITPQKAFPVERVIDTTGAGDAFAAGVIAGVVEKRTWTEAARVGCAVSAIKIAHLGARGGLPNRDQVRKLMKETV
jgi:sugar/nucleoside kinase (ribokinase family)